MLVKVTQEDINLGRRVDGMMCPIARALNKIANLEVGVPIVGYEHIFIGSKKFKTTRRTQRFMNNFDSGKEVEPFSFRLVPGDN